MRILGHGEMILLIGLVGWLVIPGIVLYRLLHLSLEQISSFGPILVLSQLLVPIGFIVIVIGMVTRWR